MIRYCTESEKCKKLLLETEELNSAVPFQCTTSCSLLCDTSRYPFIAGALDGCTSRFKSSELNFKKFESNLSYETSNLPKSVPFWIHD